MGRDEGQSTADSGGWTVLELCLTQSTRRAHSIGSVYEGAVNEGSAVVSRQPPVVSRRSSVDSRQRLLLLTMIVLLVAGATTLALLFSWSRGAWLGFVGGFAVMIFFWPRKRIYGLLLLGLGMFLMFLAAGSNRLPTAVTARLTGFAEDFTLGDVRGVDINDENYSVLERQAHWQAGLEHAGR